MESSDLVPTPIVNASGISTTVYRKAKTDVIGPQDALAASTKPRTMKSLMTDAAVGLGISKAMSKRLAQKSYELDTEAQNAMLNLMNQIDPHGTVTTLLLDKFGKNYPGLRPDGDDGYKHPDMEKFSVWVYHAENHLHAVDALVRRLHPSDNAHKCTDLTIAGLHLHRGYSTDEYRRISLVTAAASVTRIKHRDGEHDLTTLEFMSTKNYVHLNSDLVIERIASNHETAEEAIRLITEDGVCTNAELIHRLDGTPRALVSGVI